MTKPPIWLDSCVLIDIDRAKPGITPVGEVEIAKLKKDGHLVIITDSVQREFLNGKNMTPRHKAKAQAVLNRLGLELDSMADRIPPQQVQNWRQEAARNGLSAADAAIVAEVKASAQARGIRNPILLTRDKGGTIPRMRQRGVMAVEMDPAVIKTYVHKSTQNVQPRMPVVRPRVKVLKAGIKGAFSPASIASLIPDIILAVADRVALRDTLRKIATKFLTEGFAKGVAAGVMGWTEEEVDSNLKNRVTPPRIQDLHDPAGFLKRREMFALAEACENYAVDVGYQFSLSQPLGWRKEMIMKGGSVLVKYGYHFGEDPAVLFEFEFIDKLAWVLKPATDAIAGPAIRFD